MVDDVIIDNCSQLIDTVYFGVIWRLLCFKPNVEIPTFTTKFIDNPNRMKNMWESWVDGIIAWYNCTTKSKSTNSSFIKCVMRQLIWVWASFLFGIHTNLVWFVLLLQYNNINKQALDHIACILWNVTLAHSVESDETKQQRYTTLRIERTCTMNDTTNLKCQNEVCYTWWNKLRKTLTDIDWHIPLLSFSDRWRFAASIC